MSNQQPEPGGGRPYTDTKTWNYDAAGRMSSWYEEGPWGSNIKGETLFYDGDGRPVGKSVIWHYTPQFEYYSLVSSVTGKRVLDVMASGSTSEPFGVQVYLGDTLIYDETYRGESDSSTVYGLGYRLTDPISGSLQQIHADGSIPSQTTYPYARVELAGLGTSVPLEAPQTFPEIDYSSGGFPGNAGSGCSNIRLDGFEVGPGMCDTAKWMLGHGMATIDWERSDSWALSRMGIMAVHHQFETPDWPSTPDDPNTPEDEGIERVGSTADWWEYKVWGNPQIGLRVPPQGIIGQAVNDVRAILSGDNDCSKFFGLSGPIYGRIADRVDEIIGETERLNVLPVLDALSGQLRPGFLVGDLNNTTIGIRMTSRPGRGIDVQSGQLRFRIFENATVNNRGPFMRTGTFGNYTGRAGRALAILHEMAHMIRTGQVRDSNGRVVGSAYLIPDDGAATNQSETNTALIEEKCKKELDLIGR